LNKQRAPSLSDTKNFRAENFLKDLYENIANIGINDNGATDCMINLIDKFKNTLNTHAPFRNLSQKEKKLRTKPWLSKGQLKSICYKNELFSQCLSEKSEKNFKLWEYFKKYRNKLTHRKEQVKKLYYQNTIYNTNNKQNTAQ